MTKKVTTDKSASAVRVKDDKGAARDKVAKFRELATKRVTRAKRAIRLVGNLANRSSYAYTDDDVARIISTLADAVQTLEQRFSTFEKPEDDFTL